MVKAQVEGFRCVRGRRGRTGDAKATGDSKYQLGIIYAHKWLLSWSRGLLWLKRDLETTICNLRYCRLKLFVYGWLIPMLISWVLRKSTKHLTNLSKSTLIITWGCFLFARAACLHSACHVHTLIMQCTIQLLVSIIYPFRRRSLKTCCI